MAPVESTKTNASKAEFEVNKKRNREQTQGYDDTSQPVEKKLKQSKMSFEKKVFKHVYAEWLNQDGTENIEGTECDLDWDEDTLNMKPIKEVFTKAQWKKAVQLLLKKSIIFGQTVQDAQENDDWHWEWTSAEDFVKWMLTHLSKKMLRQFWKEHEGSDAADFIASEFGWE